MSMYGVSLSENDGNGTNYEAISELFDVYHEPKKGLFYIFENKLAEVVIKYYIGHVPDENFTDIVKCMILSIKLPDIWITTFITFMTEKDKLGGTPKE